MSFGLFKNILLINFKKNWIMVLSFFIFLIVSCAMLFGLTSFIIGFRKQVPEESFQKNKYTLAIENTNIKTNGYTDPKNPHDPGNYLYLSDHVEEVMYNDIYKPACEQAGAKGIIGDNNIKDPNDSINYFAWIINHYKGNLSKSKLDNEFDGKYDDLAKLREYVYANCSSYNFLAYAVNTYFLKNNLADVPVNNSVIKPKVWAVNNIAVKDEGSYKSTVINLDTSNTLFESQKDNGYFQHPEYKDTTNVAFTTSTTEKDNHYKLGQKIKLTSSNGEVQEFTYGGNFAPDLKKIYVNKSTVEQYFIMNYQKTPTADFHESENTNDSDISFAFYYNRIPKGMDFKSFAKQQVSKWFIKSDNWSRWMRFDSYHKFYNAFFLLNILLIVILLILNIILAWFLIRVMIDSMSQQILFLKAMGLKDSETSLINTSSILVILIAGIGIGIVASLGIQGLFAGVILNFMEVYIHWWVIQPLTAILIVGLPVLLCVIYFVLNYMLLRNLKVRQTAVVKKSEFAFGGVKNFLFNRNVNFGITFAFNIKNSLKMLVAFIIVFLMTALTFVCGQFITSVGQGNKERNIFSNYKDVYSTNLDRGFSVQEEKGKKQLTQDINYDSSNNDAEPIDKISQIRGRIANGTINKSYITRKTIDDYIATNPTGHDKEIKQIVKFEKSYDSLVSNMWPDEDHNFQINFGTIYEQPNEDVNEQFEYSTDKYKESLVVLKDNSAKAKLMFKDVKDTFDSIGYLPMVSSYAMTTGGNFKKNQVLADGTTMTFQEPIKMPGKIVHVSTRYYNDGQLFVRQSDLNAALSKALAEQYGSPEYEWFKDTVTMTVLDNQDFFNAFWDKGMPIMLRQFVVAYDGPKTDWEQNLKSALDVSKLSIVYVSKMNAQLSSTIRPLTSALLVVCALCVVLMLVFIIFMDIAIMNENDEIIFIMKALGYTQTSILRRIITGYFVSIDFGIVIGLVLTWGLLTALNSAFMSLICTSVSFFWTWPMILLIIAFIVVLSGITLAISIWKIHSRTLTKREE